MIVFDAVRSFLGRLSLILGVGGLCICGLLFSVSSVLAANGINRQISYQGKLLDSTGAVVSNGVYSIKFSLYTASSGGSPIWTAAGTVSSPSAISVTVQNGLFTVMLGDTSVAGGSQNSLNELNWQQDNLYLGVTIGSDSEMSPRKRIGAVPQAFNAEQLQGMFASSTASGGQTLFTINQTENNAATGTRSALVVRSNGTSSVNDYLFRGVNDLGNEVFALNRLGSVTSAGSFAFLGSGTSTLSGSLNVVGNVSSTNMFANGYLTVNGSVTLGDTGADLLTVNGSVASSLTPFGDGALNLGTLAARWNQAFFVNTSSTYASSTYLYAQRGSFVSATSTAFSAQDITAPVYTSTSIRLVGSVATTNVTGIRLSGKYAVTFFGGNFELFDIASSTRPVSLGSTNVVSNIKDLAFQGRYLYVATEAAEAVYVYDLSTGTPTQVSFVSLPAIPQKLRVQGSYAYVLAGSRLVSVDISNPFYPRVIGIRLTTGSASDFWVNDRYAFVLEAGGGNFVRAYDLSNPANITFVSNSVTAGALAIEGVGGYLFSISTSNFYITDARRPTTLVALSSLAVGGSSLVVAGDYAFVSDGVDLKIIDITNTAAPFLVTTIYGYRSGPLALQGEYLYMASLADELRVLRLPSAHLAAAGVGSLESGILSVRQDGRIGGSLYVSGGVSVGTPGLSSFGALSVHATNTTSTIMGNLAVGTSTRDVVLNSSFIINGDDLFVGGNIGSASSVYTNGSFIAGSGTYYNSGSIVSDAGDFVVTSTGNITLNSNGLTVLNPALGVVVNGTMFISTSSSGPVLRSRNDALSSDNAWGAYFNRLLVGDEDTATGTNNFAAILSYDHAFNDGLCLKRNGRSCPDNDGTVYSLIADDVISSSNAFDLAESYAIEGMVTSTDVLVFGSASATVRQSIGVPYDPNIIGVASTRPGFLLGQITGGVPVALTGRVPTKVSTANGMIAVGDPLTTSEYPGVAMKATKPGMILGYALESAVSTSTIEVFVKTGYSAGSILGTDGRVALLTDDLVIDARAQASASVPMVDSWGLTFRGSVWDGLQTTQPAFSLLTQVITPTSSRFVVRGASSTLFSVDQQGSATIGGDLILGGRVYPAGRQGSQSSRYVFLDDTNTSTQYIATNADGWQANDSYDFAERYYSPDKLEPGDVVIASERGRLHVQRARDEKTMLIGIVSTRPAFVAGKPDPDTYPIALAGRVPTKVSAMSGAIKTGDPLAPSTIPGVVVKATKAGPTVGLALENYDGVNVGKIEVFVNPGWWGGPGREVLDAERDSSKIEVAEVKSYRGFALVEAGAKRVHVGYESVLSYPNIQVTPRGQVQGGWWTDNYSDTGFDIFLPEIQARDVTFAWSVEGTVLGTRVYRSDGTYADVNPSTGEAIVQTVATTTQSPITEPVEAPSPSMEGVSTGTGSTLGGLETGEVSSINESELQTVPEPQNVDIPSSLSTTTQEILTESNLNQEGQAIAEQP